MEDFLQGGLPGLNSLFDGNLRLAVGKHAVVRDFPDIPDEVGNLQVPGCIHDNRQILRSDFADEGTGLGSEHMLGGEIRRDLCPKVIAHGHEDHGLGQTVDVLDIGGLDDLLHDELIDHVVELHDLVVFRKLIRIACDPETHDVVAGCLELGRDDVRILGRVDREGNQGRRHIHIIEGTGRGILAAY